MVAGVEADSPAARAGLHERDVIVAVEGIPVAGVDDLLRTLNSERIGKPTRLTRRCGPLLRKG